MAGVGYFGPEGTFTHEALLAFVSLDAEQLVPLPTIHDTVMAVEDGTIRLALVPIENSLEGAVTATLDTLAIEAQDVQIIDEFVYPISQCLIAASPLAFDEIEVVASHPQATGQCRTFLRTRLPNARVVAATSTAEAVRTVSEHAGRWAALGNRLAAELYGCQVLLEGVEDEAGNETRFVLLARAPGVVVSEQPRNGWKTAIVFWGVGSESPGWLVRCLSEFATRDVNLTRIESRPRKQGLGSYMFFADMEGRGSEPNVAAALAGLRGHVEVLRVLGSFPAATSS